jgi:hypothetical protein
MTKEQYHDLQDDYIQHILEYVKDNGNLFPHISIFADIIDPKEEEMDKPALIHIPIDDEYMKDEDSKDEFVDEVLPKVFKELKKRFIPHGIAWAAEAWMRVVDKNFNPSKDNWKSIPVRKEVIMISIESEDGNEFFMYEIKRSGKQVNSDGEFVDIVELERFNDEVIKKSPEQITGRFTGLFKKFKN